MQKVFALVPAAGQGTRIGDALPKQYLPVAGKPMMFHCVETLAAVSRIARVYVCLSPLDRHWGAHDWSALSDQVEALFCGGARRAATMPRLNRWRAQTPQMVGYGLRRRGLENKPAATDEAEAVESIGYNAPRLVQGESTNIKVTFAEDLRIAELILQFQGRIEL